MYWPHGVPRVYAVNGPDIAHVSSDEDRDIPHTPLTDGPEPVDTGDEGEHDKEQPESQTDPTPDTKSKWEDEAIKGVCVSRSGQMFATMSESSIALWQTRVCRP
jgi:hypothetical protein